MKITTKKIINYCITGILIASLFSELLYSYNNLFSFLFFIPDVLLVIAILASIRLESRGKEIKFRINKKDYSQIILVFYVLYTAISAIWGYGNLYNIATRFRYIVGGIAFFLIVKRYLTNENFKTITIVMVIAQIINLFFSGYQNLRMHLNPDFCNGIFGFTGYANAATGYFCLGISLIAIAYYIDKTWPKIFSFFLIIISCIICAFSEVKAFYVIFVITSVLMILFGKKTRKEKVRSISLVVGIVAALYIAWQILLIVFPYNLRAFNISGYISYDSRTNYAGRLNTISYVYKHLFKNKFIFSIFGAGLGSENFLYIYEQGKTFSECGFIGLILLYSGLIANFLLYVKSNHKGHASPELLISSVMSVGAIIAIVIWNCTFTRFTYLYFYFLAISFVRLNPPKMVNKEQAKNYGSKNISNYSSI